MNVKDACTQLLKYRSTGSEETLRASDDKTREGLLKAVDIIESETRGTRLEDLGRLRPLSGDGDRIRLSAFWHYIDQQIPVLAAELELQDWLEAPALGLERIAPIRIFFDTEFTDLGIDPRLISIGLVSEDGHQTFYAELSDTYQLSDVGDFARQAVLPQLQGGDVLMTMRELGERLTTWLQNFGEPVKLATDSLAWDWPWIQEIFHELGNWPQNLDGKPVLLTMNYLREYDKFLPAVEAAFAAGLRRHHALDDAKANRLGWLAAGRDISV